MFASHLLLRRCLLATSCLGLLFPATAQAQIVSCLREANPDQVPQALPFAARRANVGAEAGDPVSGACAETRTSSIVVSLCEYGSVPLDWWAGPGNHVEGSGPQL